MHRLAQLLLHSVLDNELPVRWDPLYIYFLKSRRFPNVEIKIVDDFKSIKQQYTSICRAIIKGTPKKMTLITLFAANEQLMLAYNKVDSDIPRLQAIWFDDLIKHVEQDLEIKHSTYFMLISTVVIILYCFKYF